MKYVLLFTTYTMMCMVLIIILYNALNTKQTIKTCKHGICKQEEVKTLDYILKIK